METPVPRQRGSGGKGRGRKAAARAGKKRAPQRGMGVAQLEHLRWEEEMREKFTGQKPTDQLEDPAYYSQLLSHTSCPASTTCGLWGWDTGFVLQRLGNNNNNGLSNMVVDPSRVNGAGGSVYRAAGLELSSIPKLITRSVIPPTDHCEVCIKKKRFSSVMSRKLFEPANNSSLKSNSGNYNYSNQVFSSRDEHFSLPSAHNNNLVGTLELQLGSDEKKMEFEFFPAAAAGKNGSSTASKVLGFSSSELLGSTGTSYNCSASDHDSNLVDLSLKLSY